MTQAITPAELPGGHPKKAYIGVDGETYRILIPVEEIDIERVEGRREDLGHRAFSSYIEVNGYLDQAARTAPKSGYDKHPFEVRWIDGQPYEGRYDLTNTGDFHSLQNHMRGTLNFVVKDPSASDLWHEDHRKFAAMMLEVYDLGQPAVPAPADWEVVHDYRQGDRDFRTLQKQVFDGAFGATGADPE